MSTAIIILGIGVILAFISHPRYLPFIGIGAVGMIFIAVFLGMASYRMERLKIWRNPEAYEKGFQTIQGLYAIGSGGIFGSGLGSSVQKLGFVPEAQNDMIFSIICEETGLCGAVLLILLFALLIWRLMVIATHAGDLEGALISGGIYGAYCNSGYFKYCGCDKYNSKYWNYPALCQLWRDFCCIFTGRDGNGACSQPERKAGEQVAL